MKKLYTNLIFLFVLILIVIYLHYYDYEPEFFELNQLNNMYEPIGYIIYPLINNFTDEPGGYDSGTRQYTNLNYAQQVAQGLDTN